MLILQYWQNSRVLRCLRLLTERLPPDMIICFRLSHNESQDKPTPSQSCTDAEHQTCSMRPLLHVVLDGGSFIIDNRSLNIVIIIIQINSRRSHFEQTTTMSLPSLPSQLTPRLLFLTPRLLNPKWPCMDDLIQRRIHHNKVRIAIESIWKTIKYFFYKYFPF